MQEKYSQLAKLSPQQFLGGQENSLDIYTSNLYINILTCNKSNFQSLTLQNLIAKAIISFLYSNSYNSPLDQGEILYLLENKLKYHMNFSFLKSCTIVRYKIEVFYQLLEILLNRSFYIEADTFIFFSDNPYFYFSSLKNQAHQRYDDFEKISKKYNLDQIQNEIQAEEKLTIEPYLSCGSPQQFKELNSPKRYQSPLSKQREALKARKLVYSLSNTNIQESLQKQKQRIKHQSLQQIWGPNQNQLCKLVSKTCLFGRGVNTERFLKKNLDYYKEEHEQIKQQEKEEKIMRKNHRYQIKKQQKLNKHKQI